MCSYGSTGPAQETRSYVLEHADYKGFARQHELDHAWPIEVSHTQLARDEFRLNPRSHR